MEMERPADALLQYQRSLERNPNRFNTVYGAGKAAELAGDITEAKTYFELLLQLKGEAASQRDQLTYATSMIKES